MTKPLHQLYLLLPLVFITWWTLTFGFNANQTNLNGEGKLTVNVAGNTHLVGASMEGKLGTDLTTGTLSTQDIKNKASYQSMSGGVQYASSTTHTNKREENNQEKGEKGVG